MFNPCAFLIVVVLLDVLNGNECCCFAFPVALLFDRHTLTSDTIMALTLNEIN